MVTEMGWSVMEVVIFERGEAGSRWGDVWRGMIESVDRSVGE